MNFNIPSKHHLSWSRTESHLSWLGFGLALLVGGWLCIQSQGVVNNDGILYLEASRLFAAGQWQKGLDVYNWPFYSLLILAAHKFTGLDYLASAQVLGVLCFGLASLGISVLIHDVGGKAKEIVFGQLLLLSANYLVGDILPMVVREHGFWAAFVWSIIFFFRFDLTHYWQHALLWGATAGLAVLFRIEGLVFLSLLPVVILFEREMSLSSRLKVFLKANAFCFALGTILILALVLHPSLDVRDLGRLSDPWTTLKLVYQQLTFGIENRAEFVERALGGYLDDFAIPTLVLGMVYILLIKSATVAGFIPTLLTLGFFKRFQQTMAMGHIRLFAWILILALLTGATILLKGFVLPKRILSPIGFVLVVLGAFGLAALHDLAKQANKGIFSWRLNYILIMLVLVVQLLALLRPAPPERRFERDAVDWLKASVIPDSRVFYQTKRLAFYAGLPLQRDADWITIQRQAWQKSLKVDEGGGDNDIRQMASPWLAGHDYAVFSVSNRQKQILDNQFGKPLRHFIGPRNKSAVIYKNPAH